MMAVGRAEFDIFIARFRAQTKKRIFEALSAETAPFCGSENEKLLQHLHDRRMFENFSLGHGVLVLDMRSEEIQNSTSVLMSLETPIAWENKQAIDIIAAIFSPEIESQQHLRKLAAMSRILKNTKLCGALREARTAEYMQMLFIDPASTVQIKAA